MYGTRGHNGPPLPNGVRELHVDVSWSPADSCFEQPGCDFKDWFPAEYVRSLADVASYAAPNFYMLMGLGAFPIGVRSGHMGAVSYGVRVRSPFC